MQAVTKAFGRHSPLSITLVTYEHCCRCKGKRSKADAEKGGSLPSASEKLGLLASQRSLSADSIFSYRSSAEPTGMSSLSPAAGAARSAHCSRKHFQQLLLAFVAGVCVTYAATAWLPGLHPSIALQRDALHLPSPWLELCPEAKAPGVSLAPMALSLVTGNASAAPDRLIVCTRHSEVMSGPRTLLVPANCLLLP